ncbi:uncharacterized protein ARMOST_12093 [Armillaria ostoyae]|uniref:Uncharacterized protein n=1 Tax=Armillaria ostoyae TaxID=47428 RepID=A0A284RIZ0_ARMOS|nr:uncharacterized protein ARMOST_12093 [Armillaria ostoyae]
MSDGNNVGYTLDGRPSEPLPESWARPAETRRVGRVGEWGSSSGQPSNSSRGSGGGSRFGTLRDINAPSMPSPQSFGGGSGGRDSDEDDEDGPSEDRESWFAGGERSGISIQNPDRARGVPGGNMVRDLLRRAAEAGPPPVAMGSEHRANVFTGGGHTLGSDEVPSTFIPDPDAEENDGTEETAIRHLTFWRDGFTVEDGDLMRYDDPNNEQILAEINSGRAPPSILNVLPGQPVELRVAKHTDEDYVAPKRTGFSGSGNRLGAPVPGGDSSQASASSMPGSFPSSSSPAPSSEGARESISSKFEVDQSKPTTSIQIRLADGTRMVCRMNLTHTVLDIRNFINASRPENLTRPYSIGTTFPNRTLDDNTQTVESAGLLNSVIVQRWV